MTKSLLTSSFIKPLLETPIVYHGGPEGIEVFKIKVPKISFHPAGVFLAKDLGAADAYRKPTVYKLSIPDNLTLINWEQPYDKQPDKVKEILSDITNLGSDGITIYKEIYNTFKNEDTYKSDEEVKIRVTEYLASKGIDGMFMPNWGTHIYCIFKPEVITILDKANMPARQAFGFWG